MRPSASLLAATIATLAFSTLAFPLDTDAQSSRRPTAAPRPAFAEPGISPNGDEIAFVHGSDIWVVPARGGEARLLIAHPANESRPIYSPDGTRLAFISNRAGSPDIWIMTFADGSLRRVTCDEGAEQLDGWSRDGE
jgi:tricorn protease